MGRTFLPDLPRLVTGAVENGGAETFGASGSGFVACAARGGGQPISMCLFRLAKGTLASQIGQVTSSSTDSAAKASPMPASPIDAPRVRVAQRRVSFSLAPQLASH